jgi:hypothetical protein
MKGLTIIAMANVLRDRSAGQVHFGGTAITSNSRNCHRSIWVLDRRLTMRLSGKRLRRQQSKMLDLKHPPFPWFADDVPRSPLEAIARPRCGCICNRTALGSTANATSLVVARL